MKTTRSIPRDAESHDEPGEVRGRLDALDRRIIDLLETDGRMTNRAIGQALGESEISIARRLRRMETAGAMTPTVFTSFASFGYPLAALLRLEIDPRRRREAEAALVAIEHVFMLVAARNFDRYAYVATVAARDLADLGVLLERSFGAVPGCGGFELHLALEALRLSSFMGILPEGTATGPNLPLRADLTGGRRDDLDVAIIRALEKESRGAFAAIADSLGVSEPTVRRRVASMTEEGAIRFGPLIHPRAIGLPWLTIAWIDVEPARMRAVAERLRELPAVRGLYFIAGPLGNLYASLHGEHAREVPALIENEIHGLPGVRRVTTQEALRVLKYSSHWRHMEPEAAERPFGAVR